MTENVLKTRPDSSQGFTLIEMAIVVVIIGILMAAGLRVASVQRDSAAYSATRTKQEAIKQALINYLRNNQRLPCPDNKIGWGNDGAVFAINSPPDGIENRAVATGATTAPDTTVGCDARSGVVPWITLGLPRDAAIDGFGNFFTYHITAPAGAADDWNITASFNTGLQGGITVNSRANNAAVVSLDLVAVVVVVSHGKDGLGAWTVKGSRNVLPLVSNPLLIDEDENANGDAIYVIRDTNNDAAANGGAYDDVVLALTSDDLLSPLIHEQSLNSLQNAATVARQTITGIENAMIGFIDVNFRLPRADCNGDGQEDVGCYNGTIPWATLGINGEDPWSTPIQKNYYQYAVSPSLANGITTFDKTSFIATAGALNVATNVDFVTDAESGVLNNVPFVVYSLGSNNQYSSANAALPNKSKCSLVVGNPATDLFPVAPPNCYGIHENNGRNGTAGFGNQFVRVPVNIPATGALAKEYYDDILDFVSKGELDAKLP
jgi:prepilin-type N-terminal cleavage/methylation domain-containing protein